MRIVRELSELRQARQEFRAAGESVALVPTMGALHAGHLSLVTAAKKCADRVVVSIFVNPKQFGPSEDFALYPRQEEQDAALLESAGADLLYLPDGDALYPPGFATILSVAGLTTRWEGAIRPGHFEGVATVVAKLLLQAMPDKALFGEKDYQQLQVIRRMAIDLDLPVEIIGCPIIRDAAGLALSSRNAYLTAEQLQIARTLNGVLHRMAAAPFAQRKEATGKGEQELRAKGFTAVDYIAFVDGETLEPLPPPARPARLIAVARLGATRLLDNVAAP